MPRLSGQTDVLPVILSESMLPLVDVHGPLTIQGQLRSFNNRSGVGNRLVLTVFARQISSGDGQPQNQVRLTGTLCREPVLRRTPLGRRICDLMLAVPRRYGRADYLPVIAWGQLAAEISQRTIGDSLDLVGQFQSRPYQKVTDVGIENRIAYEISVMQLIEEAR